jgi:hypothetical protein
LEKATQEANAGHELLRYDKRVRASAKAAPHGNLSVVLYLPVPTPLNRCGDGSRNFLRCLRKVEKPQKS